MHTFLTALILVVASAPAFCQNPRAPHELNPAAEGHSPVVATDGELSVVTWHDGYPNYRIHSSVSNDQGRTWSAPVVIDNASGAFKSLRESGTQVVGDHIYVSWFDDRLGASVDQYFTVSTDGGATWSLDRMLDKGYPTGVSPVQEFRMAANEQYIFVLMKLMTSAGYEEIWGTRSADGGVTWDQAHSLTNPLHNLDIDGFDLALNGAQAHMVWIDDRANGTPSNPQHSNTWRHSIDLTIPGISWWAFLMTNASDSVGNTSAFTPSVVVSGSVVVVTFCVATNGFSGPWEVRTRTLNGGGIFGWGPETVVGNYNPALGSSARNPRALFADNGDIFVTWQDSRNGLLQDEIFVARSTDVGVTFQEHPSPLGLGTGPRIAGSGDYFGISFTAGTFPNYSTHMVVSRDGGTNFGIEIDITEGVSGSNFASSLVFNDLYQNFLGTWQSNGSMNFAGWVGGLRSQTMTPAGTFSAGNLVNFRASRFGTDESGHEFMVVVSPGTGNTLIQWDWRNLFLQNTGILIASYHNPLLKATLSSNGDASTPQIPFPPSFAPGTTLYAVGVSRNGGNYDSITDVIEIVTS